MSAWTSEMLAQYGRANALPDPLDGRPGHQPILGDSPVRQAAEAWQAMGCPRGLLLHDEALAEAERWASQYAELGESEQDFLQECRDAERHAQREGWLHSLLRGVVALAILSILVAAHGWWTAHEDTLDLSAAKAGAEQQLEQMAAAVAELEMLSGALVQARDEALGESQEAKRQVRATSLQVRNMRALALAAQSHLALEQDSELALLLAVYAAHTAHIFPSEEHLSIGPQINAALQHALGHPDWRMVLLEPEALAHRLASAWISPDGRLLCALDGEGPGIWDAASGERLLTLQQGDEGRTGQVYLAEWSRDGSRVAAVQVGDWGRQVMVWDASTGGALWSSAHPDRLVDLAWSPDDSRLLLVDAKGEMMLLDAAAGYRVTLACQIVIDDASTVFVNRATWASDGGTIRLYSEAGLYAGDLSTMGDRCVFSLFSNTGSTHSDHAKKAAPVWVSDSHRLMLTRTGDLADLACSRVTRDMTVAEWARYMGADTPYRATCPNLGNP